jgi:hypothetical protein
MARNVGAWDPKHDAVYAVLGAVVILLAFTINAGALADLSRL